MRRKILASAAALTLGAATLVAGQAVVPTTASATNVCQPPIWGAGNRSVVVRCGYVDGYPKYYLRGYCTDGRVTRGASAWIGDQAGTWCTIGTSGPALTGYSVIGTY